MAGLRGKALIAYLLVCTVWGSTYLAIRVGVMHLPPVLFAGVRFLVAGLILAGIVLATGDRLPRRLRDWRVNAITGVFLLLGGNAVVVWAEQHVESGAASVFVAAVPLWAAFFDALWPGGTTVFTWRVGVGLALGFLGSALLAGVTPGELMSADLAGPVALTLASASWALGTVYSKRNPTETSPYAASAVQMLAGGLVISLLGLVLGEAGQWRWSAEGLGALAYLVVFGSIVGFTSYAYALRHASATIVGTYAYVNPVVAVLLGWLILHEADHGADHRRDGADPRRRPHDPARARSAREGEGSGRARGGSRSSREGPGMSGATPPRLVAEFESCTLPKEEWTHQAHLTVGLWYASRLPYQEALVALREGILRLNAAHGVPTTPTRGYHETITRFYLRVLCDYVASEEERPMGSWPERVARLLSRYGDRELPLRHYTKDLLMSSEARFGWVEPDLLPLGPEVVSR